MTLAWQITSQTKSQTRLRTGANLKFESIFDLRMRLRIGARRRKKRTAEARMRASRSSFSQIAKLCGSASVAERRLIYEPTHDTRSGAGCALCGGRSNWGSSGGGWVEKFWLA